MDSNQRQKTLADLTLARLTLDVLWRLVALVALAQFVGGLLGGLSVMWSRI